MYKVTTSQNYKWKKFTQEEKEKMFLPCTQIQRSCAPLLGSSRHVRVYGSACLCVCASVRVGGRTVDFKVVPHRKAEKMLLIFQCFGKFSQSYITIMITILLKKIVFSTKKTRGGVVRRVKNQLGGGQTKALSVWVDFTLLRGFIALQSIVHHNTGTQG